LLVSGPAGPKDRTGIWTLSLADGALRKLVDDAKGGAALSPDESLILFRRSSAPEIWIVKTNGEEPRKLLADSRDGAHDSRLVWLPDGHRFAFGSANQIGDRFDIESYDLETGRTNVILSDPRAGDFCFNRDGRLIYTRLEGAPNEQSSNLWEVETDPRTALVRGTPRRLTNWSGFLFGSLGISSGGGRLVFVRLHYQNNFYVGQLEDKGKRLTHPKRLSFEQWTNWPTGWSRDSQAIFFNSDRNGHLEVFEQQIGTGGVHAVAVAEEEQRDARLSPDGHWILYLAWPRIQGQIHAGEGRLMRIAPDGGSAHPVTPVIGYPGRMRIDPLVSLSAAFHPAFRCASVAKATCVLSEEVQGQVVFTALDPIEGRVGELARLPASSSSFWDLSPDGQWLALSKQDETSGRIHLIPLAGATPREISAGDWTNLQSVTWAQDGEALYLTAFASKGAPLLRVSLNGESQSLYRGIKYVENPVASPDGRYLAFGEMTEDGNAWVIDTPRRK